MWDIWRKKSYIITQCYWSRLTMETWKNFRIWMLHKWLRITTTCLQMPNSETWFYLLEQMKVNIENSITFSVKLARRMIWINWMWMRLTLMCLMWKYRKILSQPSEHGMSGQLSKFVSGYIKMYKTGYSHLIRINKIHSCLKSQIITIKYIFNTIF